MCRVRSEVPVGRPWKQHKKPRFAMEVSGALLPPQHKQEPAEDPEIQNKMGLIEALLELMVKHEEHTFAKHVAAGASLEEITGLIKHLRRGLAAFEVGTLAGAARAWRRFSLWCSERVPPVQPLPAPAIRITVFVDAIFEGTAASQNRRNAGGFGAARSVVFGLQFLEQKLGLPLEINTKELLLLGDRASVRSRQSALLQPGAIRRLEEWALSSDGVKSLLAAAACILTYACLRFKHGQRSRAPFTVNGIAQSICSRGKSGRRDPFTWVVPVRGVFVSDLPELYRTRMAQAGLKDVPFVVPALPKGVRLEQAKEVRNAPMSRQAFQRILKKLIELGPGEQPGSFAVDTSGVTTRGMRRLCASVALATGVSAADATALGNWMDKMPSEGSKTGASLGASMSFRYMDDAMKIAAQHRVKTWVLAGIRRVVAAPESRVWTWDQTEALQLLAATDSASAGSCTVRPVECESTGSSSDSSACESMSGSSSSSEEMDGRIYERSLVEWVTAVASDARLHIVNETSDQHHPKCGAKITDRDVGVGADLAESMHPEKNWCGRCAKHLRDDRRRRSLPIVGTTETER